MFLGNRLSKIVETVRLMPVRGDKQLAVVHAVGKPTVRTSFLCPFDRLHVRSDALECITPFLVPPSVSERNAGQSDEQRIHSRCRGHGGLNDACLITVDQHKHLPSINNIRNRQ